MTYDVNDWTSFKLKAAGHFFFCGATYHSVNYTSGFKSAR